MDIKAGTTEVAHLESALSKPTHHNSTGTVTLLEGGEIILIPTPSPDPRDPLNLPNYQKWAIDIILGMFAVFSVLITSGMGPILTNIMAFYDNDPRTTDLMTYPTLFMGIGNIIAMPLAMAIGRRPVFLASVLILTVGSIWCAASQSLDSHIAGRNILSLAAGQSEALCPLIIQEIHFVHERSSKLAWFSATQSIGTAALTIATAYIVNALGWRWCDAYEGLVHIYHEGEPVSVVRATQKTRVLIDNTRYKARTLSHSLKIFHGPADWSKAITCGKQMAQCLLFPNILWVILLNSVALGIYVIVVTEFGTILSSPPYNYPSSALGLVQGGQIVVSFLLVPVLGYGGDQLTRWIAKHRNGVAEPEIRLIPMVLPVAALIISSVIFGRAGSSPYEWSPWAITITFNGIYFAFIGVILVGYTYSLDSYPERAAPILVLICAIRGLISFGISFGVTKFVTEQGYQGAFNICASITGAVAVLGLPVFLWGHKIRAITMKYAVDHKTAQG
ncbi:hypothetical protein N7509_004063 [Penicillium cosmopolitanum]|uniref:Major facilitator superfamily (MFS) profile domain-containing protein n=1 Tax=Penicillium cosmopolitanum TaxID=1131564 RepID=A0A9W9W6A2_9EURO|nr:uncharacterized protein N7509_004063 [Penicillium cosmopolitanum]KAJ5404192.1 hypothetical protein N7509_004063 [Penicillium cosmopolitanum]